MSKRKRTADSGQPPMAVCQVCRELRPEEKIETSTWDVSERFGISRETIFFAVDHCYDRGECRYQAKQLAHRFRAGEDVEVREVLNKTTSP